MTRLPTPGSDTGKWGEILNEFLSQAHTADGKLKTDSVTAGQLATGSVVTPAIADGAVTNSKLDTPTKASLAKADTAVQPGDLGTAATTDATAYATAAQGELADATTVQQVTLTAPLAYTLPVSVPAGIVHRVTFTQDGTGGHTVTYDGASVTVDTSAGATTEVEFWPSGAVVYPGAAGTATRGLIITDTNVTTIPTGSIVDNLAAYYNSGAAAITVAGVELAAGSHAVWAWVSGAWVQLSSGTSTPPVDPTDTTAPVWSATLTTGTPTETGVVVAASALATDDSGTVAGYRWRLTGEANTVARAITPSGLNFTLDGLTASTAYAAPIFWAVDAGGNKSAELTAQGFTTAAPAPVWTTIAYDTFTDADDVLVTAHTPDTGTWSLQNAAYPNELVIRSNALALRPATRDWPDNGLKKAITTGGWSARVTLDYNFASVGPTKALNVNFSCGLNFSARIANRVISFSTPHATAVETTGNTNLAPDSGTLVAELVGTNQDDNVLTLTINGTLYRRWDTIDWNGQGSWGIGAMLTEVSFAFGGDIYVGGGGYSAVTVASARIEQR